MPNGQGKYRQWHLLPTIDATKSIKLWQNLNLHCMWPCILLKLHSPIDFQFYVDSFTEIFWIYWFKSPALLQSSIDNASTEITSCYSTPAEFPTHSAVQQKCPKAFQGKSELMLKVGYGIICVTSREFLCGPFYCFYIKAFSNLHNLG